MTPREIIAGRFATRDGELLLGGVGVRELARRFGTPVFVYDAAVMERRLSELQRALSARFEVYYSIKANPTQAVLRFFLRRGCGLEVASTGELYQARAAGCPAERIVFAGPAKTADELDFAVAQGVGEIHIETFEEIERLAAAARARETRVRVAVRVNPAEEAQGGAMRMGGTAAAFGFDEEQLESVLEGLAPHRELDFWGVHLFSGTQILDARLLLAQYGRAVKIARRAAEITGRPVRTIDFGGGLGIPYYDADAELDLGALQPRLAEILAAIDTDPAIRGARLIVEPGRYLVGESGVYLTRVVACKVSRGRHFVLVDGGMHHHLAASGNLGQVIKRNFPLALVDRLEASTTLQEVDVCGPLCTPLDVLGRRVALPRVEVGDLIGILQSGAYARSASPLGFLSHPSPPEVLVEEGQPRLVRRRGDPAELLSAQFPEDRHEHPR